MIRIAIAVLGVVVLVWITASVVVELESESLHEKLGGTSAPRALVLFHPSRDARCSDDLSLALADLDDPDVRWIVRENLNEKRLRRLDAVWVEKIVRRLSG